MRIASPIVLLIFGAVLLLIAVVMHLGLPAGYNIEGPNIVYVPVVMGALQVLLAIFSIFLGRRVNPPPLKDPAFFRWVLLFIGVLVLFIGFTIFSISVFTPYLFGSEQPIPQVGVSCWLILSVIVLLIFYAVSKKNSTQRPNLMRYLALAFSVIAAFLTTSQALVLIYTVPFEPPTSFPFFCGLMTIAYLPLALLILGLSKDYVSIQRLPNLANE